MKTRKLTLLSITILAALIIGAFTINTLSAAKELKLKVKWKPNSYTLDNPPPDPWNAEIFFAPPRPIAQIDPSTLRLEGMYAPESPPYHHPRLERLVVPFHGYDVVTALLTKIPHMSPGIYYVSLEITGRLYDTTPFRGSGYINMTVPEIPPP